MTLGHLPPSFVLNTLPKAICNRFGPIATLCLCDPAKVRKPPLPQMPQQPDVMAREYA
jgi:hypothetical protein